MSRYIDADALKQRIREKFDGLIERIEINSVINSHPTANVVEVVRCKDCRYWQDNQEGHYPNELCPWDKNETPDEDDYCSFGERREDVRKSY